MNCSTSFDHRVENPTVETVSLGIPKVRGKGGSSNRAHLIPSYCRQLWLMRSLFRSKISLQKRLTSAFSGEDVNWCWKLDMRPAFLESLPTTSLGIINVTFSNSSVTPFVVKHIGATLERGIGHINSDKRLSAKCYAADFSSKENFRKGWTSEVGSSTFFYPVSISISG